jgi:8-oxo-dGTP diphosphatase
VTASETEVVQAAGGAVWRRAPVDDLQVLVVHRPRYDDWSLPKGKLENGETHAEAALREVEEETGLRCALGPELPSTFYRDRRDRPKTVRYWAMTAVAGRFVASAEVDQMRWVSVDAAGDVLTYERDRAVLAALAAAV